MTETEKKALALLNEVRAESRGSCADRQHLRHADMEELEAALCRAIEQHEVFRQEVSDAVEDAKRRCLRQAFDQLERFIIVKPDPLVEVMQEWWDANGYASIETFRAALAARGLEVRKIGEGE